MEEKNLALEGIRKKLLGKELNYKEIFAIMDQIAKERLGDILTTYFVASGYSKGFTPDEIYYLTKAMVETGEHLTFKGIVADKHSIGGTPGTRATLIVIPIIAAAGFKIPKSSSRAITTPAGTADCMETIAKVTFTKKEIEEIVEKTNACIVWGGSFKIAPADDDIIRIEEPLLFESFDKILVSVMAKKIAFGSNHIVIDIPYGKTVKVGSKEDGEEFGKKFEVLGRKFNMKVEAFVHKVDEPAGGGIGPLLETRDALMVLEQRKDRPMVLEERALNLSSILLKLCIEELPKAEREEIMAKYKTTKDWARDILTCGQALLKMKEIIKAQKGDPEVTSLTLKPGKIQDEILSHKSGVITEVNNKHITQIAKLLGAPRIHEAGLDLYKRKGEVVAKREPLFRMYTTSRYNLREAIDSLPLFPIYDIK